jgi:hypothetical protein
MNVDADVIAQPLYAQSVAIPNQGTHNVLYLASQNDTLYAFDADNGALLWATSYVNPGASITAVPASDLGYQPHGCYQYSQTTVGITSTPVIDRSTGTIYLDAFVKQNSSPPSWHHYLHAVDMTTGLDFPGSPQEIAATIQVNGSTFTFTPLYQANRPALLEDGGNIYIAFGSQCDANPLVSFGWIFAYSASSLQQVGVFNTSPDYTSGLASFWMSGYGPAGGDGFIYAATGNGNFNAYTGGYDFGDAVLKFSPTLALTDYFEPWEEISLDHPDSDLGSGGLMLLPAQPGAPFPLAVIAGKDRNLYLLNRSKLGGYTPGGPDNVVQVLQGAVGVKNGVWGGPAYYLSPNNTPYVYYCGGRDYLKAFALVTSPSTELVPAMQTSATFGGHGGTIPTVSSNGQIAGTGIVWAVDRPPNTGTQTVSLRAFDATKLGRQLFTGKLGTFDNPHTYFFDVPTVINGKVYVSTGPSVTALGLR